MNGWMDEIKGQLLPLASTCKGSNLLTSSSVTPLQVIQLDFLLGFLQLLLYFSQILLDLFALSLEEKPQGFPLQLDRDLGWLTHPWHLPHQTGHSLHSPHHGTSTARDHPMLTQGTSKAKPQ